MKRRHFLLAGGAGLASGVLPNLVRAASCPPPTLNVTGGTSVQTACPIAAPVVRVSGNKLVDGSGQTLKLRGVNISGLELVYAGGYSTTNPWGTVTGFDYPRWDIIGSWGINAVRLPLNEASWNGGTYTLTKGQGSRNADPGSNYRAVIKQTVDDLAARGWYVILELHFVSPGTLMPLWLQTMPNVQHSIPFWSSVAATFKNYPNVIFDLFNEPRLDYPFADWVNSLLGNNQWVPWRDGTTITQFITDEGNPLFTWQSAGMQTMLNAVRAAGANNVVICGGDNYSSVYRGPDGTVASGWVGHVPNDPAGQLACSFHAYPDSGNQSQIKWGNAQTYADLLAVYNAGYPIVFGEAGSCCDNAADDVTWSTPMLQWVKDHNCAIFGWAWNPVYNPQSFWNPVLVSDANGTPSSHFGKIYHDWLAAGN